MIRRLVAVHNAPCPDAGHVCNVNMTLCWQSGLQQGFAVGTADWDVNYQALAVVVVDHQSWLHDENLTNW